MKLTKKSKFFENFDQNRNYFENFTQIEILQNFRKKSKFFVNFEKIENFRKCSQIENFSKIWLKSEIFRIFWTKSKFFEIFRKIWLKSNRNLFEKSLNEIIKIWPQSKFIENFFSNFRNRFFRIFWPKSKIFENLTKNRNLKFWPKS